MEPSCWLKLGDKEYRTRACKGASWSPFSHPPNKSLTRVPPPPPPLDGGRQPLWSERVSFAAVPATATTLFLTVKDKDEEVGSSAVLLANAFRTGREECRLTLSYKGKPAGEVTVVVSFTAGPEGRTSQPGGPSPAAAPAAAVDVQPRAAPNEPPAQPPAAPITFPTVTAQQIFPGSDDPPAVTAPQQQPAQPRMSQAPAPVVRVSAGGGGGGMVMMMPSNGSAGNLVQMAMLPGGGFAVSPMATVVHGHQPMVAVAQPAAQPVQVVAVPPHGSYTCANVFPALHGVRKILMCLIDATDMGGPCNTAPGAQPLRTLVRYALHDWAAAVEARQASAGAPAVGIRTLCSDPSSSGTSGSIAALDSGFMSSNTINDLWSCIPWGGASRHSLAPAWQGLWSVFAQEGMVNVAPLLAVLVTDGAPDDMQALGDNLQQLPTVHLLVALFGTGGDANARAYQFWTTLANYNPRVKACPPCTPPAACHRHYALRVA